MEREARITVEDAMEHVYRTRFELARIMLAGHARRRQAGFQRRAAARQLSRTTREIVTALPRTGVAGPKKKNGFTARIRPHDLAAHRERCGRIRKEPYAVLGVAEDPHGPMSQEAYARLGPEVTIRGF